MVGLPAYAAVPPNTAKWCYADAASFSPTQQGGTINGAGVSHGNSYFEPPKILVVIYMSDWGPDTWIGQAEGPAQGQPVVAGGPSAGPGEYYTHVSGLSNSTSCDSDTTALG